MIPILELEGITKVYPSVVANKNISLSLQQGEIHAICGENGAGKTTLMKIIFGMEAPTRGKMFFNGEEVRISSSDDAIRLGIGMVHQHFMLVPSFTVAQNLVLGIEPVKFTRVNHRESIKRTREIAEKYNLDVDPEAKVESISVGMMQKLEILKALYRGAKVLILDEPTAVLTPQETEELFEELRLLKERGHTIVFISHKLDEVKNISDRVTVIRKGEVVETFTTNEVDIQQISQAMIGRVLLKEAHTSKISTAAPVAELRNITSLGEVRRSSLKDFSLTIRSGEILGIAGVEGNGQSELVSILSGAAGYLQGSYLIGGEPVSQGIKAVRNRGVSYIPEDRMKNGVAIAGTVWENMITNRLEDSSLSTGPLLNKQRINAYAQQLIEEYEIICKDGSSKVGMLSGGNIQKIVVARECAVEPDFLIADQPTRGVDVGAADVIHQHLYQLRDGGSGILLISADLNELLEVCDSLVVLYEGQITAFFDDVSQINETELGLYMLGINKQERL